MLGLVPFLEAAGVQFNASKMKVHLACWNGYDHPIDVYYAGKFKQWQEWQTRRNFSCPNLLSVIDIGSKLWMFAGVYKVLDYKPHPNSPGDYLYSTELVSGQDDLIGRIIVYHQRSRSSYIWNKPTLELPIVEIRREKMTIGDFPGYNSVAISHSNLQTVIRQRIASWHGALANIKGVYLITDTNSGMHYVGKASGNDGIWERWSAYANNGHGGNAKLKQVLRKEGSEYAKGFQYSILEIADNHASDADILARESYWMNILRTREFGLN